MVFVSLILLFLEFINSYVGVETKLGVHFLEDLDLFAGLQVMVHGMMETNHLEVTAATRVKIPYWVMRSPMERLFQVSAPKLQASKG